MKSIIHLLEEKKAENIKVYQTDPSLADFCLVATANSLVHAMALVRFLQDSLGKSNLQIEGYEEKSEWLLVDTGDFFIHIITQKMREHYELDKLWPTKN